MPQNTASATITWAFAIQLLGVVAAYRYVTDDSLSAAFVWVPAGIGFVVTLTGVVDLVSSKHYEAANARGMIAAIIPPPTEGRGI